MYKKFLLIGAMGFIDRIKPGLAGLALEIDIANMPQEIRPRLRRKKFDIILFDADSYPHPSAALGLLRRSRTDFVIFSSKKTTEAVLSAKKAGASDYMITPYNLRELNLRLGAILNKKTRISCIGGGTGLFNLLMGLKELPDVLATSIVSMTDDGGSSGRLRESFGVLPPGDVRRSLVALSNAPQVMNEIMTYRFKKANCFIGHNFGNLLLTVLNDITGSMPGAIRTLSDILNIRGIVLPVSTTKSTLCALLEDGRIVRGESNIDLCRGRSHELRIKRCWHEPDSKADVDAFSSIINADTVVIGPGDLYTSVITNFLIKDIRGAVTAAKAEKVYVCNLMTKPGETSGFGAADHVREVLKYLKEDCLDYVIISDNNKLSMDAVLKYSKKGQAPVETGSRSNLRKLTGAKIMIADVSHETELIRHDSRKLAAVMSGIIKTIR